MVTRSQDLKAPLCRVSTWIERFQHLRDGAFAVPPDIVHALVIINLARRSLKRP